LDGYATILSPGVPRKGTITQSFEKRRYEALKQGMSISFIGLNIYSLAGDNFRSYQYNNKDIVFPTWEIDFAKDVTILPAKASSVTVTATPNQKAQETVYKGVEQSTANIQMIGNVYGLASNPSTGIDEIRFSIGLAPGAAPVDLTRLRIVFSTPTISPIILAQGATATTSIFTTKLNGDSNFNSMNPNDQIEIAFKVSPVSANTKINIELRPSVGAALPFTKTAPSTISATNVLY
jgi:archaellin